MLFGLSRIALLVAAVAPGLGISAIIAALILLCAQDVILTIYYYFYGVEIPIFSSEEKLKIKEGYSLLELAWSLNTDNLGDLIELILDSSDLLATRVGILGDLELQRILGHLIFLAEQEKRSQRVEIVKPKAFYHSFWKKVGACEAISQALQVSREIERPS